MSKSIIPIENIAKKILVIRKQSVILDRDLAELYGVETKTLKRNVRRHMERFPKDFMFELSKTEFDNLRRQFGTSSWGGTRYLPMVFTEQGVAMLSSVLNSKIAIEINILIMRAFVRLRELLSSNKELALRITQTERDLNIQGKTLNQVLSLLNELLEKPMSEPKQIGFKITDE